MSGVIAAVNNGEYGGFSHLEPEYLAAAYAISCLRLSPTAETIQETLAGLFHLGAQFDLPLARSIAQARPELPAAVQTLGGDVRKGLDYRSTELTFLVRNPVGCLIWAHPMSHSTQASWVCTRYEFIQEARRLGYSHIDAWNSDT